MHDGEIFDAGFAKAVSMAAAIADKWAAENREARDKARQRGSRRNGFDGDQTDLIMADQLDGAAIECNAIAQEIRKLLPAPVREMEEL